MNTFGRFQQVAYALNNDDDDGTLAVLKTGTVLSVSIFEMMLRGGKSPGEFNSMDWHEILGEVGQNVQGQNFSVFVFDRYARYIDVSVQLRRDRLSDTMQDEVTELAGELRDLTTSLQNGGIKEPDYVDRCLWISFEAMMKLLSSYLTSFMGDNHKEYRELIEAIVDLSIQYARCSLYSEEQTILEAYLEHQHRLDQELQDRFDSYQAKLKEKTQQFDKLLENAFDPDFRTMLRSSVELAREAGVEEDKILDSVEKIDDYFS